jgi:hypothetical protein
MIVVCFLVCHSARREKGDQNGNQAGGCTNQTGTRNHINIYLVPVPIPSVADPDPVLFALWIWDDIFPNPGELFLRIRIFD